MNDEGWNSNPMFSAGLGHGVTQDTAAALHT